MGIKDRLAGMERLDPRIAELQTMKLKFQAASHTPDSTHRKQFELFLGSGIFELAEELIELNPNFSLTPQRDIHDSGDDYPNLTFQWVSKDFPNQKKQYGHYDMHGHRRLNILTMLGTRFQVGFELWSDDYYDYQGKPTINLSDSQMNDKAVVEKTMAHLLTLGEFPFSPKPIVAKTQKDLEQPPQPPMGIDEMLLGVERIDPRIIQILNVQHNMQLMEHSQAIQTLQKSGIFEIAIRLAQINSSFHLQVKGSHGSDTYNYRGFLIFAWDEHESKQENNGPVKIGKLIVSPDNVNSTNSGYHFQAFNGHRTSTGSESWYSNTIPETGLLSSEQMQDAELVKRTIALAIAATGSLFIPDRRFNAVVEDNRNPRRLDAQSNTQRLLPEPPSRRMQPRRQG